jgi:ABC-type transporter Mla MlaB component
VKLAADALSFEQALASWARIDEIVAAGEFDLSDVAQVDSAGISLLLETARRAKRAGRTVAFVNAPPQLRSLIAFFGIGGLLGLDIQ